ncbi:MAG: AraC family transcriptional regulator [Bacteroidota bacterium]|nr:AraC family transcriptional regulator [Bacteroidota bacterium]
MKLIKTYPKYLQKHIKFFYSVQASALENINSVHRRLPDGTLDVVFNLGAPVLFSSNGINFFEMPEVVLTGLHPDRSFLQYAGDVNLVGAVFQPGSAQLFVNDTLEQYKGCTANASQVFGNEVQLVYEQLKETVGEKEKHTLLEKFLLTCLKKKDEYYSSRISGVINQIHTLAGNIEMSTLYKDHFMSERTFRRKFNECVGMSPKLYSTIIRVKSFSKRYEQIRSSYTNVLNELGYTDQSHFNKEFQKIVGTNPTAYFSQLTRMGTEFIHLI